MGKVRFDYWKDGKKRALAMSYDDGVFQDRHLVEIFNKFGIRGSFHLNAGLLDSGGSRMCPNPGGSGYTS